MNVNSTNSTCSSSSNSICKTEILQAVAYTPVFILGLLLNVAALWAFIAKRHSWTDTHIYMLNLAIADIMLVLFLPFRIRDSFYCLDKTFLCTVLISIHYINMYISILTSTAISVNRYLAVRFPLQFRSWRWKKEIAVAVCLVLWLLVVTVCLVWSKENYPNKLWTCFERCKDQPLPRDFLIIMETLGFLVPVLITVFCSSQIIWLLLQQDYKSEEKKSIVGIVTANMIVFIICYTPLHVAFLVNLHKPPGNWQSVSTPAHKFILVSEWIASTNCCFDSISYYFLLSFLSVFKKGILRKSSPTQHSSYISGLTTNINVTHTPELQKVITNDEQILEEHLIGCSQEKE